MAKITLFIRRLTWKTVTIGGGVSEQHFNVHNGCPRNATFYLKDGKIKGCVDFVHDVRSRFFERPVMGVLMLDLASKDSTENGGMYRVKPTAWIQWIPRGNVTVYRIMFEGTLA